MHIGALSLLLTLIVSAYGQIPAPDAAEQRVIVSRMRDAAISDAGRLPDLTCTQLTTRSKDSSGTGKRWKPLDTQEVELSYVSHKEQYKLLKMNGDSTNLAKKTKDGYYRPPGAFDTALRILEPQVNAEFDWDHGEMLGGKRLCVFQYRVKAAASTLIMQVNSKSVGLAHHGSVHADCDTGTVMRIHMETDPATVTVSGQPIPFGMQFDVRYDLTMIGSREFFLPQDAEEISRFDKTLRKAEIKFQQYRTYD